MYRFPPERQVTRCLGALLAAALAFAPVSLPGQTLHPEVMRRAAELGLAPGTRPDPPEVMRAQEQESDSVAAETPPAEAEETPSARHLPPLPPGPHGLPWFGYDVFRTVPAAFEPAAAGPVDPDYVIAPDDRLRLSVWGQVELQQELTVDREGRVFIPTVGQVLLTGLTLRDASEALRRRMARSYAALAAQPPAAWLDLTVARIRPKRVFVMGEVHQPGGYTMSSHATVFSALYSIGGPAITGSLRSIRVLRGGKTIAVVDLYDYLTGADSTNDLRVQSNDVLFVPVRGSTVSIRGEVRRPAVYELAPGESLDDLLRFCGGVLPTAYDVQTQIERIRPPGERTGGIEDRLVLDVPLRAVLRREGATVPLQDGDDVRVFPVLDELRNFVVINGSVWRPGRYQLGVIRTVLDLINAAEGIQPRSYFPFAHITRLNADLVSRRVISFSLRDLVDRRIADITLEPRDEVTIYSADITEVRDQYVTIRGSVKRPGRFPLHSGMTLRDLIPVAGGYAEDAELMQAEVSRVRPSDLRGDTLALVFHPPLPRVFLAAPESAAARGLPDTDFPLQHRDEVLIRPNPAYLTQQNVRVSGDIRYPGTYSIRRRGERLSEILERAGGASATSFMEGALFFRGGNRLLLDFSAALAKRDSRHDVVMLDGDSLFIPSMPHTVLVRGEVNNPGLLSYVRGQAVSDYIERAGGLTDSSHYAVLIKPTGESRRVDFGLFRSDPEVPQGSVIEVLRLRSAPSPSEPFDLGGTVKDVFAILTSAATVAFIVWQVSK